MSTSVDLPLPATAVEEHAASTESAERTASCRDHDNLLYPNDSVVSGETTGIVQLLPCRPTPTYHCHQKPSSKLRRSPMLWLFEAEYRVQAQCLKGKYGTGFTPVAGIFATFTSLGMSGWLMPAAVIFAACVATMVALVVWVGPGAIRQLYGVQLGVKFVAIHRSRRHTGVFR